MSDDEYTPGDVLATPGFVGSEMESQNYAVYNVLTRHRDSWEDALREMIDQGATNDDIWHGDWKYALPFPLRRRLEAAISRIRREKGGPMAEDNIGRVRRSLDEWQGAWPPKQAAIAEQMGITDGRIRQIQADAGTTWHDELRASEARRANR